MPKMNAEERERVRNLVTELYLRGVTKPPRIRQVLSDLKDAKNNPTPIDLSVRQVARYLVDVRKEMKESAKFNRDEEMGKSLGRKETLYRKAVEEKSWNLARLVQNDTDRLLGLIIEKHEHTGKIGLEDWLLEDARVREKVEQDRIKKQQEDEKKNPTEDSKDTPKEPIVETKPNPESSDNPPGEQPSA